jgi:hypothetical protein
VDTVGVKLELSYGPLARLAAVGPAGIEPATSGGVSPALYEVSRRLRIVTSWYPQESNLGLPGFNRALGPFQLGHRKCPLWADMSGPGGTRTLMYLLARQAPVQIWLQALGSGGRIRTPNLLLNRELPVHFGLHRIASRPKESNLTSLAAPGLRPG